MVTAGLVLAAGHSRRWGAQDKLLASWRGRPLAAWAADAMRAAPVGQRIAVCRSPDVAALFDGFQIVAPDGDDQSASLRAGVRAAAGTDALLVTLADMPAIGPDDLRALIALGAPACVAQGGRRQVPALFAAAQFPALAAVQGDRGARDVLVSARVLDLPAARLVDIDRPGDL